MITSEELKDEKFTKAYNFIMKRKDLNFGEKMMLSRALSFQHGWYESTSTIAKWAGCSERTVKRLLKGLVGKKLLAISHDYKHRRTMYPTVIGLPLFEYGKIVAENLKADR